MVPARDRPTIQAQSERIVTAAALAAEADGRRPRAPAREGTCLFATSAPWKSGARWLSAALVGGVALGYAGAASPYTTKTTKETATLATASTTGDALETDYPLNMRILPPPKPVTPAPKPKPKAPSSSGTKSGSGAAPSIGAYNAGAYNPWASPPGHPAYALGDVAGDPYSSVYGQCVWYAWYRHRSLPLFQLGVSGQWVTNARRLGLRVGSSPWVGATVVFQPNVQGASSSGHVGVVEQILGSGWFLISEMNFYFNGGGFGRVSYRYAHVGAGVAFIS
jgi:surface antigen